MWVLLQDHLVEVAMATSIHYDDLLRMDLGSFYCLHASVVRCKFSNLKYLCTVVRASQAEKKDLDQFMASLDKIINSSKGEEVQTKNANDFIRKFGAGF
jgi:hypothetical protein